MGVDIVPEAVSIIVPEAVSIIVPEAVSIIVPEAVFPCLYKIGRRPEV